MATSMASSLVRRGFRLASSSSLLFRHRQSPLRLSPISCYSARSILGAQTAGIPTSLRVIPSAFFASSAAPKSGDASLKRVLESEIQCAEEDVEGTQVKLSLLLERAMGRLIHFPWALSPS